MNIARHKLVNDLEIPLHLFQQMGWDVVPHAIGDQLKKYIEPATDMAETVTFENQSGNNTVIDFYMQSDAATMSFLSGRDCAESLNSPYFFYANNFCEQDISEMRTGFRKSYFIIEVFDGVSSATQNRLDVMFLHMKSTIGAASSLSNSEFESNYLRYLNIPRWFITEKQKENQTEITVYIKAHFFNAKNGRIFPFRSNISSFSLLDEGSVYETVNLQISTFTFNKTSFAFRAIRNDELSDKINTPSVEIKHSIPRTDNKLGFDDNNLPDLFTEEGVADYSGDSGTVIVPIEHNPGGVPVDVTGMTVTNITAVSADCELEMDVQFTTATKMERDAHVRVIVYSEFAMIKNAEIVNIHILKDSDTSETKRVTVVFPEACGILDIDFSFGTGLKEGAGFLPYPVTPDCTNCTI